MLMRLDPLDPLANKISRFKKSKMVAAVILKNKLEKRGKA